MNDMDARKSRPNARSIGSLIGAAIEPLCAKRGFAKADLIAAWADVVGPRYATTTLPEKLVWPRRDHTEGPSGATLVVRVDAGMAIYLQHETNVILDRVNGFLGFGAVAKLKIVQAPVARPAKPTAAAPAPRLGEAAEAALTGQLDGIESEALRSALARLGRSIQAPVKRI